MAAFARGGPLRCPLAGCASGTTKELSPLARLLRSCDLCFGRNVFRKMGACTECKMVFHRRCGEAEWAANAERTTTTVANCREPPTRVAESLPPAPTAADDERDLLAAKWQEAMSVLTDDYGGTPMTMEFRGGELSVSMRRLRFAEPLSSAFQTRDEFLVTLMLRAPNARPPRSVDDTDDQPSTIVPASARPVSVQSFKVNGDRDVLAARWQQAVAALIDGPATSNPATTAESEPERRQPAADPSPPPVAQTTTRDDVVILPVFHSPPATDVRPPPPRVRREFRMVTESGGHNDMVAPLVEVIDGRGGVPGAPNSERITTAPVTEFFGREPDPSRFLLVDRLSRFGNRSDDEITAPMSAEQTADIVVTRMRTADALRRFSNSSASSPPPPPPSSWRPYGI